MSQPSASPNAISSGPSRWPLVAALLAASAAVGAGVWWLAGPGDGGRSAAAAGAGASAPADASPNAWRAIWTAAGLPGEASRQPDAKGPALGGLRLGDGPAIAAQVQAWQRDGRLLPLHSRTRRRTPVVDAEAVATALVGAAPAATAPVVGGDAGPSAPDAAVPAVEVQPVEVAMLVLGLARAANLPAQAQRLQVPVETPLMASRSAFGVAIGPTLVRIFGATGAATPIAEAEFIALWVVQRAHGARVLGDYAAAHRDLALAEQLHPGLPAALFARGVLQLEQGLVDRGVETCEAALARADDPMARLMLADVLASHDKPFKAFEMVEAALARHPDLAEAHVARGLLRAGRVAGAPEAERAGLRASALESFERALALDPGVPGALSGLAQLDLIAGDEEAAVQRLASAVTATDDADAEALLAQLRLKRGEYEAAIATLQARPRRSEERWWILLVQARMQAGQTEAALQDADAAAVALPVSRQVALLRAQLLRKLGKLEAALAAMAPLDAALGEEGARYQAMRAELLLESDRGAEAIAALKRAEVLDPHQKEAALLLILAYARAGLATERDAAVERVLGRGDANHEEIATLLLEAGDAASAEAVLESALRSLAPALEAARRAGALLAMILVASDRAPAANALRDRLVKSAGGEATEPGRAVRAALDEAIKGAEAELREMQREGAQQPPGGAPDAPADADRPKEPAGGTAAPGAAP